MPKPAPRKSLEPWIKDEIVYYDYQVEGIRHMAQRLNGILADDMGLGKSIQALIVFAIDVVRQWADKLLIVCPVTLKGNWQDEIEKFTRFQSVLLEGTPAVRNKQLIEFAEMKGPKILIVNYEQVVGHQAFLDKLSFDMAIFDEAHFLKNPKAKRTKACLALYSRRSWMLTGTPMLNHVNELWSLMHRCDPKATPPYWPFVNRYAVFGGYQDKQIIGVKNEKELTERLQHMMLRRLKKDVLDLKEPQYIQRRVDLTVEQRKLYDEVVNEMRLPRVDQLDPDDIENALTKFLRLKQICGSTLSFTGTDNSSKMELAVADATELLENGHRVIVVTQFRDNIDCYAKRIASTGAPVFQLHGGIKMPDRQPTVKQWEMTREPSVIICMLQIAGVGLNMVAAKHIQFLDKLFVPGLNRQAVDRAHRIGQDKTQPVQVFEYLCRKTIEDRVETILRTKSKLFGEIVETDPNWKRKLLHALLEEEAS